MLNYLQDDKSCRTLSLLRYFDEDRTHNCGHCNVCLAGKKQNSNGNNNNYTRQILDLVKERQTIHLQNCVANFPIAIREDILTLIRNMVDEHQLKLHPDGRISLA